VCPQGSSGVDVGHRAAVGVVLALKSGRGAGDTGHGSAGETHRAHDAGNDRRCHRDWDTVDDDLAAGEVRADEVDHVHWALVLLTAIAVLCGAVEIVTLRHTLYRRDHQGSLQGRLALKTKGKKSA
jgi:hypothetical protein